MDWRVKLKREDSEITVEEVEKIVEGIIEKRTEDLMGVSFPCVCGRTHGVPMKHLSVKMSALDCVADILSKLGIGGTGKLVYDRKIEEKVALPIEEGLEKQGLKLIPYTVGDDGDEIKPEVSLSEEIARQLRGSCDFLISCGSGVITDLTKQAANILDIPYAIIATAPSMNGYTSSMAALTDRGIKKTLLVRPAEAIFADIGVLMNAPLPMVRAGLGDIVSKSVCNADWKLSQIVKKTYFCPVPFRITDRSEPLYLETAEEIGLRTGRGIEMLTDGIMRSGLSMTIVGTSTPSSGAEHFISHYWDLMALLHGEKKYLHGVQVGVATLIVLRLYDFIRELRIREKVNMERLKKAYPSKDDIKRRIASKFGACAEGVEDEFMKKYQPWDEKKQEIEWIIENWDGIWKELEPFIRPSAPVKRALRVSGAAANYRDLGKRREDVVDALYNAWYIRGRYTILDLIVELGLLEEALEIID